MQQHFPLPETGYLRLWQIIGRPPTESTPAVPAIIPVGRSTWWAGVKSGRFPKPIKLGPRTTVWSLESINELLEKLSREAS